MKLDHTYELGDRYRLDHGRAYLTGLQALVRLPLMQRHRDQIAGLDTAGFISGYRGSPLGGLDLALWQASDELAQQRITFQPGLNEDLAATAVWGSQQAGLFDGPRHDGVFALWYGKGPGVDRSCDALKHGNAAGSARAGGVLVVAGDDHGAKSSTLAHQSEHALVHCGIPVLYPSDVQDVLDFGLHGWAMSRYSGCWIGLKCVTDVVESAASVDTAPDRLAITVPDEVAGKDAGADRWISFAMPPLPVERRLLADRLPAAHRYVRANGLDRVSFGARRPRVGIVTAGKAYGDVRQALEDLGIGPVEAEEVGLAVYKLAMTWPVEPEGLRDFAEGVETLLVVEEKRPLIEEQLASILYASPERPALLGKRDAAGAPLLPSDGELDPAAVAEALTTVFGLGERRHGRTVIPLGGASQLVRRPAFCAGCPHNTSTVVPEGSFALSGIGCHGMATWLPERHTLAYTHMGGEGANWIGASPFTETSHVFQNLGDGTYTHSGSLAIRAAVAAGVDITYKILVNGAVAMTGGQAVEGHAALDGLDLVHSITRQLDAEGVRRVVVLSDAPERYRSLRLPASVAVHHRDHLDRVQRELRDTPGVTAIVYDQVCAAEARRLRKRGQLVEPSRRVIINELVCEGCGDCGVQSNCIAIEPVETDFGRKRRINQDACNKDYSCLHGYCPSFGVVEGERRRGAATLPTAELDASDLPEPEPAAADRPRNVLVAGIGGTGVVTAGALLGMAAHLEGRACAVLDVTGLAQKNGPVASHVRIADRAEDLHTSRIPKGSADVVVACDLVVAAGPEMLALLGAQRTTVIADRDVSPTADFAGNPDLDLSSAAMESGLASSAACFIPVPAAELARSHLGSTVTANIVLLGVALQRGLLPVSRAALERAIELNGTQVEANRRALTLGRLAALDPGREQMLKVFRRHGDEKPSTFDEMVGRRVEFLVGYQNRRYAERYRSLVDKVAEQERAVMGEPGPLAEAVARYYFKLLAYKDEYEVARLWTDPVLRRQLDDEFEPGYRLSYHLAPQGVGLRSDPRTGRVRKLTLGPWFRPALRLLAAGRRARGTPLDFFGRTEHRRTERRLITEYEATIEELLRSLDADPDRFAAAVEIASIPEHIRGFGTVKEEHLARARADEAELKERYHRPTIQKGA